MRFLVMVFLSLFLMTNVSVAEPVDCRDLKKTMKDKYAASVKNLNRSNEADVRLDGTASLYWYKAYERVLEKAGAYAALYTALCK